MKRNCIKLRCLSLTRSLVQLFRAFFAAFSSFLTLLPLDIGPWQQPGDELKFASTPAEKKMEEKLSENYPLLPLVESRSRVVAP